MYYKQLIKRGKLVKFWIFFGGEFKSSFKFNYNLFSVIYNANFYINFNKLIFSIKNLLPIFLNKVLTSGTISFVATRWLYSKAIYNEFYQSLGKELPQRNPGMFSNVSVLPNLVTLNKELFTKKNIGKNPCILVFFCFSKKDYLILEAKKKKIPSVGLINKKISSLQVDYPVFLNSGYFHVVYFFSKFLFKLIFLEK